MKIQSLVFALFLVAFTFISTRSRAQQYSIRPESELEASLVAHQFGELVRSSQLVISEAQKADYRSIDAMHWTVVGVNRQSQSLPTVKQQPVNSEKVFPSGVSIYKPVKRPIRLTEKSLNRSL